MALAVLLSGCGGSTREDVLGLGGAEAGGTGPGGTGAGVAGGTSGNGGAAPAAGSGGQSSEGGAGGTLGSAGDTASGGSGGTAGTGENGECVPGGAASDAAPPAGDGGSPDNLISNPSFESGHSGWVGQGAPTIVDVSEYPHTGLKCLGVTNRSQNWMGPMLRVDSLVTGGTTYEVSAWVRGSAEAELVNVTLKTLCPDDAHTSYWTLGSAVTSACSWTHLSGQFVAPTCALPRLDILIEGARPGVDIFVDDVALVAVE